MSDGHLMPVRVQLRRTKGWRLPPNTIVVSRPSKWGNPWQVGKHGDRAFCLQKFEEFFRHGALRVRPEHARDELRGKNLACWCKPGPCHADVLLEIANS